MEIKSNRGTGVHAGKILAFVNGKRVFVHLRSALETHSLGEIAVRQSQRVHTVSIDNAKKVADHMSESFAHAKRDDVVVLLYTSDETRMAALAVLGLCDG
jgi:predicted Rossmann-fold nucleotide-binding protein